MAHAPPSLAQSTSNQSLINNSSNGRREPTLNTDVDDPSHPLYHHRRIVTDFDYGEILGEGSYSTVLIGRDKRTGKQYAIKRLDKAHIVKNNKVKYVMIERDALSRMNHPGIVKLYWTYKDNRSLYFVLDLARNGELYTYIRRLAPFDLETAKFYAAEILLSIEHIHNRGVIHRDIKPENILLDDNSHIKITDFGSAKIINENEKAASNAGDGGNTAAPARSFVGTAEYVSPELLRSDVVSEEADLWALGCVIYQMLSGKSPFKAATDYLIFQKIKNLEYTMPDEFPPAAKDIVERLLASEPEKRLGSAATGGINAIKEHPFFEGIDWEHIFTSTAPPLRERLEKEAKAHPVAPPTFNFGGGHDDDEDDEEDLWLKNAAKTHNGMASGSALIGALAGALAQTTITENTANAPSPSNLSSNDHSKIPAPISNAPTASTQPQKHLKLESNVAHSRQSSCASQLQPQPQTQSVNSDRSSLSSDHNSILPPRTDEEAGGGGGRSGVKETARTQPHLPW
ncbi:hypothetical protein [Parasitella parasitica]|uniref:non-specific serine/threonine protein kinase n=1 Tax=Parasitella parasitica TaxID=35722 RepID=A0A0B7N391_9FUNG|nr:hypothetical protein [Parasitella parasitica]